MSIAAQKVLKSFAGGNSFHMGNISTDGKEVYSYHMLIARRNGTVIEILDVDCAPTRTTTMHIKAVLEFFKGHPTHWVESFE